MLTPIDELIKRSRIRPMKPGIEPLDSPLLTGNEETDKRWLKALIALNGLTPTKIAAVLGISSQAVSRVIHRHDNSRRVFEYLESLPVQVVS